ncbi:restriction endonuclease subunit S [Methanococcoides sp. AM1]|uniref:restriction endonuclease subunit S n=1 Tax=Methanococcoides sp. AM1 TaxID=1201011 RepID=UPI0010841205|nr:restriction endonuclease subunit S [Methanococcoides sp. AM1]
MKHELPDGWKYIQLGDLTKIKTGKLDVNAQDKDGQYPFFTCSQKTYKIAFYDYDCECVLVAGNGDLNVKYYDGKFNAYQRTYIIESLDKEILDVKYLYYFLRKYITILRNKTIGGVIKYIKLSYLTEIKLPIPSIKIQKKIVAILEKADETRKLRTQADEFSHQLLQSVFMEMFGDPVKNNKGWNIEKVEDAVLSIEAGWSANGEQRRHTLNEYGVLKVSAVTQGIFLPEEHKAIKENTELKKVVIPERGDVLFSRANTLELVGATCIIKKDYPCLLLPDKLWKIKVDTKVVTPVFLKFVLSHPAIRAEISKKSTGTSGSMYNISMKKLKSINITIPPIEIQNKFTNIVDRIEQIKDNQKQSSEEISTLFNALTQKAFTGDLIH